MDREEGLENEEGVVVVHAFGVGFGVAFTCEAGDGFEIQG